MKKKKQALHPLTIKVQQIFNKFGEQQRALIETDEQRQLILKKKMQEIGIQDDNYEHIKSAFAWWYGYLYAPENWQHFLEQEINRCTDALVRNRLISLGKPFAILGSLEKVEKSKITIKSWSSQRLIKCYKFSSDVKRPLLVDNLALTIAIPYGDENIVVHPLINMAFSASTSYLVINEIFSNEVRKITSHDFIVDNFFLLILIDYAQAQSIVPYVQELQEKFIDKLIKYAPIAYEFLNIALSQKLISRNDALTIINEFIVFLKKEQPIIRKNSLYVGALLVKSGVDKKQVQQLLNLAPSNVTKIVNKMNY